MTPLKIIPAALALALAAGCALSPLARDSLDTARAAYGAAQQNPQVARFAAAELDLAGRTLNHAERLAREGASAEQVSHAAYVASQRAATAREIGLARAAEAELAAASETRNRVLLEARAREAEAAQQQAAAQAREADAARQRAETERSEAEQARSQAEQARLQAEQAREDAQRAQRERQAALQAQQEREAELSAELRRFESELRELRAQPTDRGWVLSLGNDLLFDVGQATLKPGGRRGIEQIAQVMQRHPERRITVEGFTDSTGDASYNERLSEQRAQAVKQALIEQGIAPDRIATRGYGEAFPVASNANAAGRQLNRRVQLVLTPVEASASVGATTAPTR